MYKRMGVEHLAESSTSPIPINSHPAQCVKSIIASKTTSHCAGTLGTTVFRAKFFQIPRASLLTAENFPHIVINLLQP